MKTALTLLLLLTVSAHGYSEDISLGIAGWEKTQAGDHKGAIDLFQRCIAEGNLTPSSLAQTYRNLGIALRRDGRPKESLEWYGKAIALQPEDVHKDYVNRGNAHSELADYAQALADYDQAQALVPGYDEAFFNRGIVFERLDRKAEAVAQFKQAYDAGCRTQQLYERFVAHGLIDPAKEEAQKAEAQPDRTGRTSHILEIVGIESFADHKLSLSLDGGPIRTGQLPNWSKDAAEESGSVILPGPMSARIEATLVYGGKTYHDVFERPQGAKNAAAIYELSWNLTDGSQAWNYAGYEWRWQGLDFEASFHADGSVEMISVEQRDGMGRTVHRFVPVPGGLSRTFIAIVPEAGPIRWLDFSAAGVMTRVTCPKGGWEDSVRLTLDAAGKIQAAHTKRDRSDDYSVAVDVTPAMDAMLPDAAGVLPFVVDWEACLAFAQLSVESGEAVDAQVGAETIP